jgi:hypothetical protein
MKWYLKKHGFNIIALGVLDYQTGWNKKTVDTRYINISVDFSMYNEKLDIFIDHHHGVLKEKYKNRYAIKKSLVRGRDGEYSNKIGSCFELIAHLYGIAVPREILETIDMVDAAKYHHYGVDIKHCIHYNKRAAIESDKPTLVFGAMFNQLIKRADRVSIMEIIKNVDFPSIYNVYLKMVEFFPGNNCTSGGGVYSSRDHTGKKEDIKVMPYWCGRRSFFNDRLNTMNIMKTRTRGGVQKRFVFNSVEEFKEVCAYRDKEGYSTYKLDGTGYVIIGNLAVVPTGSWTNGIRLRAIIEEDYIAGNIPQDVTVDFMLLQYGATLQLISYNGLESIPKERMPVMGGVEIDNLGEYMSLILDKARKTKKYDGFSLDETEIIDGDDCFLTESGGHVGIGTISNIKGDTVVNDHKYEWLHIFMNQIISHFSGIKWEHIDWEKSDAKNTAKEGKLFGLCQYDHLRVNGDQLSVYESCLVEIASHDKRERFNEVHLDYFCMNKNDKPEFFVKLEDDLKPLNKDFEISHIYGVYLQEIDRKYTPKRYTRIKIDKNITEYENI